MRLVKPTLIDLLQLASQARPDEIAQYEALVGRKWDIDDVANGHFNRPGIRYTLLDANDAPVVAGGYDPVGPGIWQSWMLGTMDTWGKHWRSITKASRFVADQLFEDGARRL